MNNYSTFSEISKKPNGNYERLTNPKIWLILLTLLFCTSIAFAQNEYITLWQSDNPGESSDTQIIIPASGTFDYTWEEDGNASNSGSGSGDNETTIDFGAPGAYVVKITPTGATPFHRISFTVEEYNYGVTDRKKLKEIRQWGSTQWSSMEEAYVGCENLEITATDIPDLTNVTSMRFAFPITGISTVPNMNDWDVSNVTNMLGMFSGATAFNQYIGGWDVSNVSNMGAMFSVASTFNQNISGWDVSNVTYMSDMFRSSLSFNQDISSWDVSNVTSMARMFASASVFNQDISSWDVSIVGDMQAMFSNASIFDQDISGWDVGNVSNMAVIFSNASAFDQDLGSWDLTSLSYAVGMLDESGLSCKNYSKTLQGWANNPNTATNINLFADTLTYSPDVIPDRDHLINELGWHFYGDSEGSCTLSAAEAEFTNIDIYPNPVRDFVTLTGLQGNENIALYDINGRLLQNLKISGNESQLDLSSYAKGIYLLEISSNRGRKTEKIVKQ